MIVVILAAGYGKRMSELTENTPKPLLEKDRKTLLDYKLEALPEETSEVVIVIGYLGEKIIERYGYAYNKDIDDRTYGISSIPISYVWQKEMLGSAHALWEAKDLLTEGLDNELEVDPESTLHSFMVLMGDDIYAEEDLNELAKHRFAVLVAEAPSGMKSGKCIVDKDNHLKNITEDETGEMPGYAYTGACMLPYTVFEEEMALLPNGKEYGLPQTFIKRANKEDIEIVKATKWVRVTSPEDLK